MAKQISFYGSDKANFTTFCIPASFEVELWIGLILSKVTKDFGTNVEVSEAYSEEDDEVRVVVDGLPLSWSKANMNFNH